MKTTSPTVLVTGAAKRIGKQTATLLHQNGYNIVVHCNHSTDEADAFVSELNAIRSNSAKRVKADITKLDELQSLADGATAAFGRIDMLVNNASSFYPTPVNDVNEDVWDDLMGTNLKAPFFLIKNLLPELTKNKGNVVNMVDIHADRPLKDYPVYCMAKAGLVMLTKSLSRELAPNIRVNGIAPGAILWHENDLSEQDKKQVLSEIGLARLGSPEDIAEAILYMSKATYVTGQILAVDGGRSINGGSKA
ncbi:pteridine reductase [Psychrosphaera haliotis]|uniref:pteridine reductase n=1 Tax=Psychrosphaera haliotis TaxID=555083 RepID=UPI0031D5C405